MNRDLRTAAESVYVVRGGPSPEAIASSLRALLPARHHHISPHRFTVLDTFDGRVRRAGGRLTRAGTNGASTVAWQERGEKNPLTVRVKNQVSFVWDLPDGPLHDRLAPVVGVRRLLPQAVAEEHGALLDIVDDRQKTVARVRIESGRARLPRAGDWRELPTVITLTGLRGYEETYERLVPVIESRPGLECSPDGFEGVALRELGALPAGCRSISQLHLAPSMLAEVGARQIHRALLDVVVFNEPGLRARIDTEFLHDFRVAVRRTRSLLGQIRRVFPADAVAHFTAEFSWLGKLTGRPRDLDVLGLSIRAHRGEIPAADLDAVATCLDLSQRKEHGILIEALDGDRYRCLLADWRAFLDRPSTTIPADHNAHRSLADVVARRAWRLSRRIADAAIIVDERTPPERIHEVRIDAKKLRYLIDVTPSFYDADDLAQIVGSLKKLQRVLGDFNDSQVQEGLLLECGRALADTGGPPGAALAIGALAERNRQRRDRLRAGVVTELSRFSAPQARWACRRAFRRAHAERVR